MQNDFSKPMYGVYIVGVSMLLIPVNLLLLEGQLPGARWLVPLLTFLFVLIGNGMQSIYAQWLGKRSTRDALVYDQNTFTKYHYTHAILPLLFAIGFSIVLCLLLRVYMEEYLYEVYLKQLYENNPNAYYVEESFVPYLAAVLCFVSQFAGIVIWFYPPARLYSYSAFYVLMWSMSILFVEFCLYAFTGGIALHPELQGIFMGCLTVFGICMLVIYSQGKLENSYRGSVVSIFTPEDRLYNVFLILALLVVLCVVFAIVYVVVNGLYTLISLIIWLILYFILRREAEDDPVKQYEYFGSAQRYSYKLQQNNAGDMISLLLALLLLAVLLFIGIKTGWLKGVAVRFYEWLRTVLGAIFQKRDRDGAKDAQFIQNYVDEKRKTQNALIRKYQMLAENVRSYKAFLQQLSHLPDADAQLCFAYAVLVRAYGMGNVPLKQSDTPREVMHKVMKYVSGGEEICPITEAFETIWYANGSVPVEEETAIVHTMCEIIHRYMA